jgi:hypothetical protein
LCGLRYATIELCFLCVVRVEKIREWELASLEFPSSKGTAVWPEEELEDLVCNVNVCYSYSNLERLVTTNEDPINRFTNPNPWLSHRNT